MKNKDFHNWVKNSEYEKAQNLIHKLFDKTGQRIIGQVDTRTLLQAAFEAGQKYEKKEVEK